MRQVLGEVVTGSYDDDYYKSQYALLQNETLAAQVIREVGLANSPYFRDWNSWSRVFGAPSKANESTLLGIKLTVIERYLKRLTITPLRGTNLVKVSFTTPDPDCLRESLMLTQRPTSIRDSICIVLLMKKLSTFWKAN